MPQQSAAGLARRLLLLLLLQLLGLTLLLLQRTPVRRVGLLQPVALPLLPL